MNEISNSFNCCITDENYRYPMNEYIYKMIHPILEDMLFMGDGYEETFLNTEILISLFQASLNYSFNSNHVWGTIGRYKNKFRFNFNIQNLPIYEIAKEIGILERIKDNERDFVQKFNTYVKESI